MYTTSQLPGGSRICWEGNNMGLYNKIGPRQKPEGYLNYSSTGAEEMAGSLGKVFVSQA